MASPNALYLGRSFHAAELRSRCTTILYDFFLALKWVKLQLGYRSDCLVKRSQGVLSLMPCLWPYDRNSHDLMISWPLLFLISLGVS